MGVGSFGRGWLGSWGDGATPSVSRLGSVGGVAVAGQDFSVGHQLPLDVAWVDGVADEAADVATGLVLDAASLVGRGAGTLVDVERIALGIIDEGAVVAGVVDLPFLLDVADEAVGIAPGVGGGCAATLGGGGLGLLVAAVELVLVGGARGITGVAIRGLHLPAQVASGVVAQAGVGGAGGAMVGDVGVLDLLLVVGAAHDDAGVLHAAQGVVLVVAVFGFAGAAQCLGIDLSASSVVEDLAGLHGLARLADAEAVQSVQVVVDVVVDGFLGGLARGLFAGKVTGAVASQVVGVVVREGGGGDLLKSHLLDLPFEADSLPVHGVILIARHVAHGHLLVPARRLIGFSLVLDGVEVVDDVGSDLATVAGQVVADAHVGAAIEAGAQAVLGIVEQVVVLVDHVFDEAGGQLGLLGELFGEAVAGQVIGVAAELAQVVVLDFDELAGAIVAPVLAHEVGVGKGDLAARLVVAVARSLVVAGLVILDGFQDGAADGAGERHVAPSSHLSPLSVISDHACNLKHEIAHKHTAQAAISRTDIHELLMAGILYPAISPKIANYIQIMPSGFIILSPFNAFSQNSLFFGIFVFPNFTRSNTAPLKFVNVKSTPIKEASRKIDSSKFTLFRLEPSKSADLILHFLKEENDRSAIAK